MVLVSAEIHVAVQDNFLTIAFNALGQNLVCLSLLPNDALAARLR